MDITARPLGVSRAMILISLSALFIFHGTACSHGNSRPTSRSLYSLEGRTVFRTSLPGPRHQAVYSFGENPPPGERIRVANGTVAWLEDQPGGPALAAWDGKIVQRYILHRQGFARNFKDSPGDNSREKAVPDVEDAFLDDFILSPDGTRLAWGVNITTGGTALGGGTFEQEFLVFLADPSGPIRRILRQPYRVDSIFADSWEKWRLRCWRRGTDQGMLVTRYHGGQLSDSEQGIYRLDSTDGKIVPLDEGIDKVIGFSEDGRLLAHTANEESCCGGVNYTNNVVGVKDLSTGKDRTIFDEWARFGNKPVDPGDVEKVEWEDYIPAAAFFSPGDVLVALSVGKWSFRHPGTARMLTFIIPLAGSGRELVLPDRSALGWLHDSALILTGGGSTFLLDLTTGEETLLLKPPAVALEVAP